MTIQKLIKCDGPNCEYSSDVSEPRAGGKHLHNLTLGDRIYPANFHFCCIECIIKFLELRR